MNIIKSKRKSKCKECYKLITQKYKVEIRSGWEKTQSKYFHLSCYFRILKKHLEIQKKYFKEFSKQKYKKQMILESLE